MIYAMVTLLAILDQFSYSTNNLVPAHQQPEGINATLTKECELARILGSFENPPLPIFFTTGLGLVPKHDGSGG